MSANVKIKTLEDLTKLANNLGKVLLRKYLLPINVGVSIGCCTCAEVIEQKFIEQRDTLNLRRIFSMGCAGFLSGFTGTYWYLWSGRIAGKYKILKQLLLYQLVFTPFEYMQFYFSVGLLEGQSLKDVITEVKKKFLFTYLADWIIFPPLMFINFKLIPLRFRFIYDNSIQLMWCVFLSFLKHHDLDQYLKNYAPTLVMSPFHEENREILDS
eukprot:gene11893-2448_t